MLGLPKLMSIPLDLLPHVCKRNDYKQNIYIKKKKVMGIPIC